MKLHSFSVAFTALALCLTTAGAASAQTAAELVGTWVLVGNDIIRADGSRQPSFGPRGTGSAIFSSNGRFAVVNINPDTPKYAANNRAQGTAEEDKAAVMGGLGIFGTYAVSGTTLTLQVEGSTYPNWSGVRLTRTILSLTAEETKWAGGTTLNGVNEFSWKRAN